MKAKTWIRIAIVPVFIKLLGHFVGHSGWDKPQDPKMQEVVNVMKGYTGEFMGADYNMAAYLTGYSLMILCVYIFLAYLLWVASGLLNLPGNASNKIVLPIAFMLFGFGVLEFLYFFPFAASMSLLAGALIVLAITVGKK